MYSNNQSFFIEEVSQYDIIDESYSIMYKDMQNWHNLQLAIYECVLNEGNIINFIKDIIHKIIETLKKWWKNITDFIKKVINNIKSKLSNRDKDIENINPELLKDIKVSRELVLMVLHGKEFINDYINSKYDNDFIDDTINYMNINLDTNDTENIKEQLEEKISDINKSKKDREICTVNSIVEMFFAEYGISETDSDALSNLFKAKTNTPFSRIYQDIKKTIEDGTKLFENLKKDTDQTLSEINKKLNDVETTLTQVLKDNNDPDVDKLVRKFISGLSYILKIETTSTHGLYTSAYTNIFAKATDDLESIVNSLIKKSKEDK